MDSCSSAEMPPHQAPNSSVYSTSHLDVIILSRDYSVNGILCTDGTRRRAGTPRRSTTLPTLPSEVFRGEVRSGESVTLRRFPRYLRRTQSVDLEGSSVRPMARPADRRDDARIAAAIGDAAEEAAMRTRPARPSTRRTGAGATLIEVAIGLAIAGVLLLQALPAWADWIADLRLRVHAEALARTLTRARSEAIRTGHRVTTCKSADGRSCRAAGSWAQGWLLYVDANRNGEQDADEPPLAVEGPAEHGIVTVGNRPVAEYVAFTSLGHARLLNGGLQMGTFVACMPHRAALHVVLAHSGRVRIERTKEPCG